MTDACSHLDTLPAPQPRWRLCLNCGRLVHRIETQHYADLADGRQKATTR